MFPKKFIIDITQLGFSKEFIQSIFGDWFSEDYVLFHFKNTLIENYYDIYEDRNFNKEYLKRFLEKLVEIGIDLETEEYIILTIGEYTAEQIREGRF